LWTSFSSAVYPIFIDRLPQNAGSMGMWFARLQLAALLATVLKAEIRFVWSVMIADWLVRMSFLLWRYRKENWGRLKI
jgi:Na+-driven multidrug efflux pump